MGDARKLGSSSVARSGRDVFSNVGTRIAAAVSDDERRNPELAQEMRDWDATIGDGMQEPAKNAKSQAR